MKMSGLFISKLHLAYIIRRNVEHGLLII